MKSAALVAYLFFGPQYLLPDQVSGHSWVEKVGLYGGKARGYDRSKDDLVLQRYFCPEATLEECQPPPKHGIVLTADAMRPCRSDVVSSPRATVKAGEGLYLKWAGNGHVNNGQSDGSCVIVKMTPFDTDPDFSSFSLIPGAECIEYWHMNAQGLPVTEWTVTIPDTTPVGRYTLLWYWTFTDFTYSSCMDVDVLSDQGTLVPTSAPTKGYVDDALVQQYLTNGCNSLASPDSFCQSYLGAMPYCKDYQTDTCSRSVCQGGDFLLPCPGDNPSPIANPPPVPMPSPTANPPPVPSPTTNPPPVPVPSPTANPPPAPSPVSQDVTYYKQNGCQNLATTFCEGAIVAGSYCKTYQTDECGRSICQHDSALDPCPPASPTDEDIYFAEGCNSSSLGNGFCSAHMPSGSSYCKTWQADSCGRSICHGDDFSSLDPGCPQ